jgi:predicted lipid carrier protein YhbT
VGVRSTIQYQVSSRRGTRHWLVRIADGKLAVVRGRDPQPSVTFRMPAATFARVAAGQETAAAAALAGRLDIDGDLKLAARFGEMLGRGPL